MFHRYDRNIALKVKLVIITIEIIVVDFCLKNTL